MSGIDERSEKKANELEQKAWEMAKDGVTYLTPDHAWVAADKFTSALELISNVASNIAEEKRIEWLVLRGDARHLRQWYDLAVEDYEAALHKIRAMPRVRQALLQHSIADIEEKIKTSAEEGVSFYPDLAKYLGNCGFPEIKEDDK